jgi:hypothetical protein
MNPLLSVLKLAPATLSLSVLCVHAPPMFAPM